MKLITYNMFISQKEFEVYKESHETETNEQNNRILNEFKDKLSSLAKELGYSWESKAVKESYVRADGPCWIEHGEKAVLKWGWKKINPKKK